MSVILVTESHEITKTHFSFLENEGHKVVHRKSFLTEDELLFYKDIDILSVFIGTRVTEKAIEGLPNLKLIITRSTGTDHIDTTAAQRRNIVVSYVPGYGTVPVAEHVFALLLCLVRKIVKADCSIRDGSWEPFGFQGMSIFGKTFGVIGTGAIGANVCKIAKGLGADVLAYDVIRRQELAREVGFSYTDLDDLLSKADIISLHCPLTKETYHMVDSKAISKMKDGVIIINTTRGSVIDTECLIKALKSAKVGGVGLDVYEKEPLGMDSELLKLENTVLTPHIAWNTIEAEDYILKVTVDAIRDFIAGSKINNVIK